MFIIKWSSPKVLLPSITLHLTPFTHILLTSSIPFPSGSHQCVPHVYKFVFVLLFVRFQSLVWVVFFIFVFRFHIRAISYHMIFFFRLPTFFIQHIILMAHPCWMLQIARFHSFSWLSSISLYMYTTSLSMHPLMVT